MNDYFVRRDIPTVRAHQWNPNSPRAVIEILEFLIPLTCVDGITVANSGQVALDVRDLDSWVCEGDWVLLADGKIIHMRDQEFTETYRRASYADS